MSKPAIFGGRKAVKDGVIKTWPPIDDIDREMVMASLNGGQHAFGPNCKEFQTEFAEWNGNKYAITTNSGTAALHMSLVACGIGTGDHVLVTSYSWSSSATCILHHNAIPVFVDIDFATINIDINKIEEAITSKTKAIIVVHLHGLAVNMDEVMAIAKKHNLKVIEDACQAHGAMFNGKKTGTMGDCAAFSFNQNKCLCTGEGGMFVTNDENMRDAAAQLWSFGETSTPVEDRDYHAYALGWMYRNNDLTAAFGRAQLTKMDYYFEVQRENGARLNKLLKDVKGLILPYEPEGHTHNWYNYTSRIDMDAIGWKGDPATMRNAVMKALKAEGVPADVWQSFILPDMTVFKARNAYGRGCPWSCNGVGDEVSYDHALFPAANRHCSTHFGMTTPLRAPNGGEVVEMIAEGFHKVFDNIGLIDPKQLLT